MYGEEKKECISQHPRVNETCAGNPTRVAVTISLTFCFFFYIYFYFPDILKLTAEAYPCCHNRRDFADFQKNRRKIAINRISLKKSAIQSDFIVLMERELIFQKSAINRSDKLRLITNF
jgi:hypothetical protein